MSNFEIGSKQTARHQPAAQVEPAPLRPPRPAPLFFVALAFAIGAALGVAGKIPPATWLLFLIAVAALWQRKVAATTDAVASFPVFLFLVLSVGAFHGAVRQQIISPYDLRQLPEAKFADNATWHGRIISSPRFQSHTTRRGSNHAEFVLDIDGDGWRVNDQAETPNSWQPAHGSVQVRLKQAMPDQFHYGDDLIITGAFTVPPPARNPGEFNYPRWLAQHDIYYEMDVSPANIQRLSVGRGWPWMTFAARAREWALQKLELGLEDDPLVKSVLAGIVIGDIENIPPAVENAFRETNTFHIFAVSGQDVAVVLAVGLGALQILGLLRWRWAWLLAPMLIMYCLLTGAQPSAARAVIMALLVLTAWLCGRPVSTLNLWSLAALLALGWDPKLIGNLSFQLSFGVVLALVVLTGPLFRLLQPLYAPDPFLLPVLRTSWQRLREWILRAVCALFASSLAAWIGSFPFMIYYFHQISFTGLLANLIIVPLASLIVVVGMISLFSSILSSWLAVMFNNANWLFIRMMIAVVIWFSHWPWGNIFVPGAAADWRPASPEFICADANGSTIGLIRYGGKTWLLGTGDDHTFRSVINPLRQYYGVNRFDQVILTELSSRVAGGSPLLAQMPVPTSWVTTAWPEDKKPPAFLQSWREQIEKHKLTPTIWHQGDNISLGPDFSVTVLSPFENEPARRAEDRALVLLFNYHGQTLLWAGQISFGTEQRLLQEYSNLHANILVEGKNRVEANFSAKWLRQIAPREIIVAATPFGHARYRRDLLRDWPSDLPRPRLWEQDDTGAVTIKLHDNGWELMPYLDLTERNSPNLDFPR